MQFIAVKLKEQTNLQIRRLRANYKTHNQIIEELKLPDRTYWYHWAQIKKENAELYDKYAEANLKEEIERATEGLEKKIQELQIIIADADSDRDKIEAIKAASELIISIPRMMRDGAEIIGIKSSEGNTLQPDIKEPAAQ